MVIGDSVVNKHDGTTGIIDSTWPDINKVEHVSVRWALPSGIYKCSVGFASDWLIAYVPNPWGIPTLMVPKGFATISVLASIEESRLKLAAHNCSFVPYVGLTETYAYCTICDKKDSRTDYERALAQILHI